MIWVHVYGTDGRTLLICPALDAQLWWLLEGDRWWRYQLIPDEAAE